MKKDFPGGPVVKTRACNAGCTGSNQDPTCLPYGTAKKKKKKKQIYVSDLDEIPENMLTKFLYGERMGGKTNVIATRKSRFNRLRN